MADNGLIGGLGTGLQKGIEGYLAGRKLKKEDQDSAAAEALAKKQYDATLFKEDAQEETDPNTGEYKGLIESPLGRAKREAKEGLEKRKLDVQEKNSRFGTHAETDPETGEITMVPNNPGLMGTTKLPKETQTAITDLYKKNAAKASIANQIDSVMKAYNDPETSKDQKLALGNQLLKTLNSTEGSDAVGAEEAKRLGSFLNYKIGNITNAGSFIGRDLDEFSKQAQTTSTAIRGSIGENQKLADSLRSGKGFGSYSQIPAGGGIMPKSQVINGITYIDSGKGWQKANP